MEKEKVLKGKQAHSGVHGMQSYVLCGGTFLYLILQTINEKARRRRINNEGITESSCFRDLIHIGQTDAAIISDEKTMREDTSKYKYCKNGISAWMPFANVDYIEAFNASIREDYETLLHSTVLWSDKYLNLTRHADWLGKALLEMMRFDRTMYRKRDEILLYAQKDGTPISLAELFEQKEVVIQALILGMWHYIVNAGIPNEEGRATIDALADKNVETGAVRRIDSRIGKNDIFSCRIKILELTQNSKVEAEFLLRVPLGTGESAASESAGVEIQFRKQTNEMMALSDDEFSGYLIKVKEAYREIKTLLFRQEPREFDSIYLPNDIIAPSILYSSKYNTINCPDVEKLFCLRKHIIISGTGGLGKSMMMRHLLLDAVERYEEYKLLPIFVPLKDYSSTKYKKLIDFIYEIFASFDGQLSTEELRDVMTSGRVLFLMDGLDEIKSVDRQAFEKELELLTNGYGDNCIVISSRPFTHYVSYGRFTKMELSPFSKEQSVNLIHKLDMGPDENIVKDKFEHDLKESLYATHKEFAENPLLLTIMLMTYKNTSNIPVKMHKFYSKAYDTLFAEHDAVKQGYIREYRTKLTQDRFSEYLDEFCFLSYQDENFDMTDEDCREYFSKLEAVEEDAPSFTWKDFMDDLTDAVCLMYREGQKYHFLHRSIQEYFCARFFYRQEESNLWDIAMFFDEMHARDNDKTFPMLYDMKPGAVEENVFIPMLEKIFAPPEGSVRRDDGPDYPAFVQRVYPVIRFDEGEVPGLSVTEPKSYVYSFMARKVNGLPDIMGLEAEWDDGLEIIDEYVYYDPFYSEECDEHGVRHYNKGYNEKLVSRSEVSDEYIANIEDPETVGWVYEVDTKALYKDETGNAYLISMLDEVDFPIRIEFEKMYEYYQNLIQSKSVHKKDLRNKLRKKKLIKLYVSGSISRNEADRLNSNRGNAVKISTVEELRDIISENKGRIFELKEEYEFSLAIDSLGQRCVEVTLENAGVRLTGNTLVEDWRFTGYMNNILKAGRCECTTWFQVISFEEDICYVQFLVIGGERIG